MKRGVKEDEETKNMIKMKGKGVRNDKERGRLLIRRNDSKKQHKRRKRLKEEEEVMN